MAKKGETKKVGETKTEPEKKDFQGSGVEGAKAGGDQQSAKEKAAAEAKAAKEKAAAPSRAESGIVTGEHVLTMKRGQEKAS